MSATGIQSLWEPVVGDARAGDCAHFRRTVAFGLFVMVTAVLFIRPADLIPDLEGLPIYEVLILTCVAAALPEVFEQFTRRSLTATPVTVCVLGILAAVVLSHLVHLAPADAGRDGFEFAKMLLYYLLLVGTVNTAARLRWFVGWLAVFILLLAVVPLLQYYGEINLPTVTAMADASVDHSSGEQVVFVRLQGAGIFNDPNDICHMLGVGILLCLYAPGSGRATLGRFLWLGLTSVLVWAMVLTQSRGGFLALASGACVFGMMRFGWRRAMLLMIGVVPALPFLLSGRLADISTNTETGQERIQLWSDALVLFRYNPVLGIGEGNFEKQGGLVVHNSFLQCFAELGWIGGACFLGAFYLAMRTLVRRPDKAADPEMNRLRAYLAAVVAAYITGMMTLTRSYLVPTYLVLGVAAAYGQVTPAAIRSAMPRVNGRLLLQLTAVSVAFLLAAFAWVRASVHWQ